MPAPPNENAIGSLDLSETNMSTWQHLPTFFSTLANPLLLLSFLLMLRHKTNPPRVHVLILALLFLVVQPFSLFHLTPSVASAMRHRQLVYATVGAAIHFLATAAVYAISFIIFLTISIILASCGFVLVNRTENLNSGVAVYLRGIFQDIILRTNSSEYTETTTTTGADGSSYTTTISSRREVPIESRNGEYAAIVDKLIYFASPLATIVVFLPTDLINTITAFVITPSRTLLYMNSSREHLDSAMIADVVRLGIAGAVGLWYSNVLFVSMWGCSSSGNVLKSVFNALNNGWWFLLAVIAQAFVTSKVLQHDFTHSAPGVLRVGWVVFQFRLVLRSIEIVQRKLMSNKMFFQICAELVKACFVTYFGILAWEAVSNVVSLAASSKPTTL